MSDTKLTRLWATKNKNDEWWSLFVTSPLAIAVNYMVVDIKWLTPNLITLLSFITAIASVMFIIAGGQINFIVAAALIHLSHILDCMDGQMARFRGISSNLGSFLDKLTDQIQVFIWFGAIGYASYIQSQNILPIFLAFTGVTFYSLRSYIKYVTIYLFTCEDKEYLERSFKEISDLEKTNEKIAGLGHRLWPNLRWFIDEQRKIFYFNEGVFIFMLSLALILNVLLPMLWIFAASQIYYGLFRCLQRGRQIHLNLYYQILKSTNK